MRETVAEYELDKLITAVTGAKECWGELIRQLFTLRRRNGDLADAMGTCIPHWANVHQSKVNNNIIH